MYTATDRPVGSTINPPEIVLHQFDHRHHAGLGARFAAAVAQSIDPSTETSNQSKVVADAAAEVQDWILDDYYWEPRNGHGTWDSYRGGTQSLIPGMGMMCNSHPGLTNARMRRPEVDLAGLHRSRDAGSGGYSEYHGYRYVASAQGDLGGKDSDAPKLPGGKIPAGMELFVDYGDGWFLSDERTELGPVPLSNTYKKADDLLEKFGSLVTKLVASSATAVAGRDEGGGEEEDASAVAVTEDLWDVVATLGEWAWTGRIRNALLPLRNGTVALRASRAGWGGAALHSSLPDVVRSLLWLEEHGLCLDNLSEGISTVRQAGRGAFAVRDMRKGQVVAPAPMAHVLRDHLRMYVRRRIVNGTNVIRRSGHQLMLNYCYGHPDSSILLFPYSPVVNFINHGFGSRGKRAGGEPNVELRWSDLPNRRHDWSNWTVSEVIKERHAGLILEFVALRNIKEGEEVLADYGTEWEGAWDRHVESWRPVPDAGAYVSASMLNREGGSVRTEDEQAVDPYPDNVHVVCYVPLLESTSSGGGAQVWSSWASMFHYSDNAQPCRVLRRYIDNSAEGGTSVLSLRPRRQPSPHRRDLYEVMLRTKKLMVDVPREAIEFVDKPYTKDQFLPNAFRHEMKLPEGIFPEAWMDLPSVKEKEVEEVREAVIRRGG